MSILLMKKTTTKNQQLNCTYRVNNLQVICFSWYINLIKRISLLRFLEEKLYTFIPHQVRFSDVHWLKNVTWSRICPVSTLFEGEYGILAFVSKFNGINSLIIL